MTRGREDDWMNPQNKTWYKNERPPKNGTYYVIERKRRIPVTGNVAFLERWETWAEFDSKAKRDVELKRLREETSWILRGRQRTYVRGVEVGYGPTEYLDF